jgi:DNA-binding NarL/FixJ family response regulator
MRRKIRLFHVEDYKIVRDGIRFILSTDKDILWVGEAGSAADFFRVSPEGIDLLLLDLYLDGMTDLTAPNGLDIIRQIRTTNPKLKIIVHSIYEDGDSVVETMDAGADGFISKKSSAEELIRAVKVVASGKKYICSETVKKFRNTNAYLSGKEKKLVPKERLFTKREREVLTLVAQGYSSKQIAGELFITEKTVETHRKHMVEKANVKNTVQLIAYAAETGYL